MSLSPGEELITLTGHKRNVSSIAFSTDNLASVSSEWTVNIWSTNDWSELRTIKLHAKGVFPLSFSPDCKTSLWEPNIELERIPSIIIHYYKNFQLKSKVFTI
ncbi:MAG: WD40 repeat domain-containing protein [Candidatus Hodarchaeota archaeon]